MILPVLWRHPVMEHYRADYIQRMLRKSLPDHDIQLLTAEEYSAAAVLERGERQHRPSRV
jgi:hypothetical protein